MSTKQLTQILLPNDPQQPMEAATKQYADGLAGGPAALRVTGEIIMFGGTTPPAGWLACDGAAIPVGNTALIALIGANTPDMRGRFAIGVGTFASLLQVDTVAAEASRTPVHTHPISSQADHAHGAGSLVNSTVGHQVVSTTATGGSAARVFQIGGSGDTNHQHNISGTGQSNGAHAHGGNTDPSGRNQLPYIGVNYIIKT